MVCGKTISISLYKDGKYSSGHYFGEFEASVGNGCWIKSGKIKLGKNKYDIVKWTGKKKRIGYWECNNCFERASHLCWLEEQIEKFYGKRCLDFEK